MKPNVTLIVTWLFIMKIQLCGLGTMWNLHPIPPGSPVPLSRPRSPCGSVSWNPAAKNLKCAVASAITCARNKRSLVLLVPSPIFYGLNPIIPMFCWVCARMGQIRSKDPVKSYDIMRMEAWTSVYQLFIATGILVRFTGAPGISSIAISGIIFG